MKIYTEKDIRCFVMTYNRPQMCLQAVESILAQKDESGKSVSYDIYVLDNSDNQETARVLANYPQVHYVHTAPVDPLTNVKTLQTLVGNIPYTLVLHDDDILHPYYLSACLQGLNTYKDISLVEGNHTPFSSQQAPAFPHAAPLSKSHWLLENSAQFAISVMGSVPTSWTGSIILSENYKRLNFDTLRQTCGKISDLSLMIESVTSRALIFADPNCVFFRLHPGQDSRDNKTAITFPQLLNFCRILHQASNTAAPLKSIYNRLIFSLAYFFWNHFGNTDQKISLKDLLHALKKENLLDPRYEWIYNLRTHWYTKPFYFAFRFFPRADYFNTLFHKSL